jgi:hypothetical protein
MVTAMAVSRMPDSRSRNAAVEADARRWTCAAAYSVIAVTAA